MKTAVIKINKYKNKALNSFTIISNLNNYIFSIQEH